MDRRQFLEVSGALATIELDGSAIDGRADDHPSGSGEDPATFAGRLPSPAGLNTDDHVAFSFTRLDGPAATLTGRAVTDATAHATVVAGRTATDVAFGIDDARAARDRLAAGSYETVGRLDGWPVLHRRKRTRHRLVAVTDDTAVVSVGPVYDAVRTDLAATLAAVTGHATARVTDTETWPAVLDRLGVGVHVSVDVTPDPRRTAAGVEATGERYAFRGDRTAVRTVTLFDTPARARTASPDDLDASPTLETPAATDCSVDCRGRAVVRDATIPPTAFTSGPSG